MLLFMTSQKLVMRLFNTFFILAFVGACGTSSPMSTAIPTTGLPTENIDDSDVEYYAGIIIISEYYTLLGHGFPQEAYKLLSNTARSHSPTLDEYVEFATHNFKTIEIVMIKPLRVWQREQGVLTVLPDEEGKMKFYVQIRAWGQGNMSGSVRSGDIQTLFLTVIKEADYWKIDSFATGPVSVSPEPAITSTSTSP